MRKYSQKIGLLVIFQLIALFLYAQSLDAPLFFDSKSVLQHANLSDYLQFQRVFSGRWLTELSFGLVYAVFGEAWFYQNLFNVILHAINAFLFFEFFSLIYVVVFRGDSREAEFRLNLMAILAALFFLVHPVSVYATAYLIQRSILLGTGMSLLSLIFFIRGFVSANRLQLVMAAVMYMLALMAKENCVMLPGVVLVLMSVCDQMHFSSNLKRFAWVIVLYGLAASPVIFQKSEIIGTMYEPYVHNMISTDTQATQSAFDLKNVYGFSILTQCYMFFRYVLVWILPLPQWLSIDVHFPFGMSWWSVPETVFALLYIGFFFLSAWSLRCKSHLRLFGTACLIPMILFATEFSVVRLSEQFVLYRSYFWMGFLGLAVPSICIFLNRYVRSVRFLLGFSLGVILVLSTFAFERLQTFQSEVTLWEDALSKVTTDPDSPEYFKTHRVHQNLAVAYDVAGDSEKALWHYQQAIQIHPNLYPAHDNLGLLYLKLKQPERALAHFKIVQELKPVDAENVYNMGVASEALNDPKQAIQHYAAAIKLCPDNVEAYNNLGASFMKLGDYENAKSSIQQALKQRPDFAVALFNLGTLYLKLDDAAKAVEYLQHAKSLGMSDDALENNLGIAKRKLHSTH